VTSPRTQQEADEVLLSTWSASEAGRILAPHLSPREVRALIRAARLIPAGYRHSSSLRGRRAAVYPAALLIQLLAAIEDLTPAEASRLP
jgi:hypothetical protein